LVALLLAAPPAHAIAPGWAVGPPMLRGRASQTMTQLPNGKVLVLGGSDGDASVYDTELFDPGHGHVVEGRDAEARPLLAHGDPAQGRSRVDAGGFWGSPWAGGNIYGPVTSAELYHPDTDTWTDAAPMATKRMGATATLLDNGKVLVIGGETAGPNAEI
jgi:hypothetical protein